MPHLLPVSDFFFIVTICSHLLLKVAHFLDLPLHLLKKNGDNMGPLTFAHM